MTKLYPFKDMLGRLPPAKVRVNCDGKKLWLEALLGRKWVRIAQRKNRQWVSSFANLRIEQSEDTIHLMEIKNYDRHENT